jgi:hypothetical protein
MVTVELDHAEDLWGDDGTVSPGFRNRHQYVLSSPAGKGADPWHLTHCSAKSDRTCRGSPARTAPTVRASSVRWHAAFLGIDVSNGMLRPGKKSRRRMVEAIKSTSQESRNALRAHKAEGGLHSSKSLLSSLKKVSGAMQGWGKHYRFCNDLACLRRLDGEIADLIRDYLAAYRQERERASDTDRWRLLGIESLAAIELTPFLWPKRGGKPAPNFAKKLSY